MKDLLNIIGGIGFLLLFIFYGPFSWWINLLIIVGVMICFIGMIIFGVGSALSFAKNTEREAWNYWEKMKQYSWNELSDKEKEKMISVCSFIANDTGVIVTEPQIVKALQEQLPISTPHIGLSI